MANFFLRTKFKYFNIISPLTLMLLGVLMILAIGTIDYHMSPQISFSIFYLAPIAMTAWFVSQGAGFLISIASTLTWSIANFTEKPDNLPLFIHSWNTTVSLGFFLITAYLLSELKHSLEREKTLARTDYTTGVANNRLFFELTNLEIKRAYRYRYCLTIAYIDIDYFKLVNDRFGHRTGDFLLKTVAETIKNNIRVTDIVARLGGDEFAILLPETGYEPAQIVLNRVQKALSDAMREYKWPVTFSIGAVTFTKPPTSVEEMIERADNLMYFVKHNGKNMIKHECFSEPPKSG